METHVDTTTQLTPAERRKHPRTLSRTTATLKYRQRSSDYEVRNLSVAGALLTGGPELAVGTAVRTRLHLPLYPDVEVPAKVVRRGVDEDGAPCIGLEFHHRNDITEDHIQAALLSELERSQTHGRIADLD
jgi:hypothetical protein